MAFNIFSIIKEKIIKPLQAWELGAREWSFEVEKKVEPYALKLRKWFENEYNASRQAEDKIAEKFGAAPIPIIGGIPKAGPRVGRIIAKAVAKKVSPQTIQKILKIGEAKFVPGLTETSVRLSQIKKITPPKLNLDKIEAPEDIKKNLLSWVEKNAPKLSERYPHQRFSEIQSTLEQEGFDIQKGINTFKRVFGGDTKKTLMALKGLRDSGVTIETEISSIVKTLKVTTDPDKLTRLTSRLKELQLLRDGVLEAVVGSGRKSAQYLSFRRMFSQARDVFSQRAQLTQILGRRFKPGTPEYDRFYTALKNLDPDEPKEIMNFLRQAQAPAWSDFPASIWYNAVLSGPKTHIVNIMGNTLFGTIESFVTRPLTFLIDTPIAKLTGREARYATNSMIGYYGGMARGFKVGTERFFRTLKTGFDPEEILYPSKWEQLRQSPWGAEYVKLPVAGIKKIPGFLQPVLRTVETPINIPTRLLKAADVWFKGIFEEARKFEMALPKVYKTGKSIRQVVMEADELVRTDPNIWSEQVQFGRWMTFQDAPGKITQWITRGKETIPGFRYVLPFVNIAANLMKRGFIDYSPVGLTKGIHEVVVKNPKGTETAARGIIGTVIMLGGALKYLEGDLILEAPRTKAERDAFYRQGKQPWSLRIGDRYVGIRRLEPWIYPYLTGALIVDNYQKGKLNDESIQKTIGAAATDLGEFATDASYLYGLSRLWQAINPAYEDRGEQAIRWFDQVSTGFIPYASMLRSIATAINPEVPEPTTDFLKAVKSILPWARKGVEKRLTAWGQPAKYSTGAQGTFLPIASSEITQDPVEVELERLDLQVGFPSQVIQGKKMDDATYRIYLKMAGRMSRLAIDRLIHHPNYLTADNNTKRKFITSLVTKIRKDVRDQYFGKFRIYKLFHDQFRNTGLDKEKSDWLADKAFDRYLMLQLAK